MSLPDSFQARKIILISTFAMTPFQNMGIDEWMAQEALMNPGRLFARLYSWSPGGITIGFHQEIERALQPEKTGDIAVIRRMTGGRAVYHDPSELTYSFAWCPESVSPAKGEFDLLVRQILERFVMELGETVSPVAVSDPEDRSSLKAIKSPCFASRSRSELEDSFGRKLVARAKRELGRVQFEHGSIKLAGVAGHPALPELGTGISLPPQHTALFDHACTIWGNIVQSPSHMYDSIEVSHLQAHDLLKWAANQIISVETAPLERRKNPASYLSHPSDSGNSPGF